MIDKTSNRSSCLDLGLNIFGGVALCGKIQLILEIPKLEIRCTKSASKNKQLESATQEPRPQQMKKTCKKVRPKTQDKCHKNAKTMQPDLFGKPCLRKPKKSLQGLEKLVALFLPFHLHLFCIFGHVFFFALFRRKSLFAIVYFFLRFFKFMIFWNKQ